MSSATSNKILNNISSFNFTSCFGDARQLYMSRDSLRDTTSNPLSNIKFDLTQFESSLLATILEDALCALQILDECNNAIRLIKTNSDMLKLIERKFAVSQHHGGDELDEIDDKRLDCMEYKLQKLEDDKIYVKDVLFGTYVDLSLDRTFFYLSDQVKVRIGLGVYRESLMEEEARNRTVRRDLYRQLRHRRNYIKSVYYDTDIIIQSLKTNVEDAGLNTRVRSRYVDNWQIARTEQHQQTIHNTEAKPLATIMHFKRRADQEQRVHTEVELLMNIAINENLQKIEEWMVKYDTDMEALDLKIQKKRNQFDDMRNKTQALEETIEDRARQCKSWLTFKNEREKARLYHKKMTNAAIAIQAWWRGLLVRNQLGPYKVAKRPPTAKKKK